MSVEYAPKGLFAVLTPQANTTVEPELVILTPPGFAWINARLSSGKTTIEARLGDYFADYDAAAGRFGNAPVDAIGFACTGASYIAGIEAEDRVLDRLWRARGVPVVTAASAVVDALRVLGVERVALVSPYDRALDDKSAAYWSARGFAVVAKVSAYGESDAFHPIYSLPSDAARRGIDAVANIIGADAVDAVVMLGTGMPTLAPIRRAPFVGGRPVLSCMLCLAWRLTEAAAGRGPTADNLLKWVRGEHWAARFEAATAEMRRR